MTIRRNVIPLYPISKVALLGLGAMLNLGGRDAAKRTLTKATFTSFDFWADGLGRPDGGEELADLGLEALVFVGQQLRGGQHL